MELWKLFLLGLARFYAANKKLFDWIWEVGGMFVRALGGIVQLVGFALLVGLLFVVAWIASGLEERVLRRLWAIKYVGWILAIGEAVLYYLTVIAIETATLLVPFGSLNIWLAIGIVVFLNVVTIAWHAGHKEFWPVWVTRGLRRLRPAPEWPKTGRITFKGEVAVSSVDAPSDTHNALLPLHDGGEVTLFAKSGQYYAISEDRTQWVNEWFVEVQ